MNTLRNNLKRDFSQIPNDLITDTSISHGALRVILYLFTKPESWNVYNKDICKNLEISEQTLTKYWKELLNSQWLRREQNRDERGHLTGGYAYEIGTFTVSIQSTESIENIEHSNNKPTKKQETNNSDLSLKKEIISYLNEVTSKKYRDYKNKHLSARLNEGYKLEDFKKVIREKSNQWLSTDMEKYLRPDTLFGTKFDSYLNETVVAPKEESNPYGY